MPVLTTSTGNSGFGCRNEKLDMRRKALSPQDSATATQQDWPLQALREVVNRAQGSLLQNAQTLTQYTELFFSLCVVADSVVSLLESTLFRCNPTDHYRA